MKKHKEKYIDGATVTCECCGKTGLTDQQAIDEGWIWELFADLYYCPACKDKA